MILINFHKTFDTLNYTVLLQKENECIVFKESATKLFESYPSKRNSLEALEDIFQRKDY